MPFATTVGKVSIKDFCSKLHKSFIAFFLQIMQKKNDTQWINHYLDMLISQRMLANHTVENYQRDLSQLITLANEKTLLSLTDTDIRRFSATLHASGLHPRSISRKLSAWRGFFQWLLEQDIIAINPVETVHAPRAPHALPKALSVDDAVYLVKTHSKQEQQIQKKHPDRILCDQAMFELLYSSGLRVSELTGLDIHAVNTPEYQSAGWINLEEQEVTVTGKGNKTRIIPIGEAAIFALRQWIPARHKLLSVNALPIHQYALFLNSHGKRMTPRTVQLRLKEHAQQLGLAMHVHPHMLRHSFASHILQSSGDLRAVQEMLGHASIASTQIYTSLDFQHLAQVYDLAHPHAKKTED